MSKLYKMCETFKVLEKIRVGDILDNFSQYENYFWIEYENEEPASIARSRNWLDVVMNKNKKVWVLEYESELGKFTND